MIWPKKLRIGKQIFLWFLGPHAPRGTHISASGALIKNCLDESANLAQRGIHAKFQPNSMNRLARAIGGGWVSIFDISFYNWRMSVTLLSETISVIISASVKLCVWTNWPEDFLTNIMMKGRWWMTASRAAERLVCEWCCSELIDDMSMLRHFQGVDSGSVRLKNWDMRSIDSVFLRKFHE